LNLCAAPTVWRLFIRKILGLAPGGLAPLVAHGPRRWGQGLAHPDLVGLENHRKSCGSALFPAHLLAPVRLNMLWINWSYLWKIIHRDTPGNMAQNAALGNSFSMLAVLYSLGIGGVFG
jgi:hypothetical protein